MIAKNDGWSIVLAGYWNRMIFTPEWVGRVIFQEPELETLIGLMPNMPLIYRNARVAVEISQPRLAFRPRRLDDECVRQAEERALFVLRTLQDTPLIGIGINYAFTEPNPGQLIDLFELRDDRQFADADWNIRDRRLVRTMQRGQDILNLTLAYDGQELTIEFNYHTEAPDNAAAQAAVNNRVLRLRDDSLRLLRDVYNLELAPGGENDGT